ncbi:GNAT family N-acetyltransferase [Shewanella olleyana]|uniref:GNAT family N-acetyltransferase n=1 Tax=Shewanella olleyana TaxID=135626 RepID=UPI00200F2A55|nr:GNAT family protein [Shewanella olleyana]MCL1068310.1 GNAT family N-acetyltransferase [Shewanella olleyana]
MDNQLTTQRLSIRAFEVGDLVSFTEYRADPQIAQYQSWSDYSLEQAQNLFDQMDYQQFGEPGLWFQLAIADNRTDQIMGDIALHFIDEQQMEIGFTIAKDYQQQGVAYEAVSAVIEFLFNSLNKHRIVATTDAENFASMALLLKLGFRKEGHYLQNIFFKGRWGDECFFAMLNSEYKAKVKEGVNVLR